MVTYNYTKLITEKNEIRFFALLPGAFDEPLVIRISQEEWLPADLALGHEPNLITKDLLDSLPAGWQAYETFNRRIVYEQEEPEYTTWEHPNPDYHEKVDLATVSPIKDFEGYEALSYTWGSQDQLVTVYVHDFSTAPTTIEIGQNLACALNHLRCPHKSRKLWVDAIWYVWSLLTALANCRIDPQTYIG